MGSGIGVLPQTGWKPASCVRVMMVPAPIFISPPEGSMKGVQVGGRSPLVEVGSAHIWRASSVVGLGAMPIVLDERRKLGVVMAGKVFCFSTSSPSSRLAREMLEGFVGMVIMLKSRICQLVDIQLISSRSLMQPYK